MKNLKDFSEQELRTKIEEWFERNLSLVSPRNFRSNHIDEIVGAKIAAANYIKYSQIMFEKLLELLNLRVMLVQPQLIVPLLSESITLQANCPANMTELEKDIDTFEPPGIYLSSWDDLKTPWSIEGYRFPLPFNFFEKSLNNSYAYYHEFRTLDGIKDNWEFSRVIVVTASL